MLKLVLQATILIHRDWEQLSGSHMVILFVFQLSLMLPTGISKVR
jgi:hypothetical protein